MDERRAMTAFYAVVAVLIGAVGLTFALRPGDSAQWAYGLVVLGVAFFGASAVPAIRNHGAYNALGAAFATSVCAVGYLGSGSRFVGVLAVFSAVGTVVELYNWQFGTEYLRL